MFGSLMALERRGPAGEVVVDGKEILK